MNVALNFEYLIVHIIFVAIFLILGLFLPMFF